MTKRTTLGNIRAYYLAIVVCMGGFLFGYDTGIVGGVLTLTSFSNDFRFVPGTSHATQVSSVAVGIQQAGAFIGCFAIWPITSKIGRRRSLMLCSIVFIIGVIIEVVPSRAVGAFAIGRTIAGLGVGGASVVVSIYSAEMSPREIRGKLGSFYQWVFTWGVFTSYWINYGVANDMPSISAQWQIPIALQMVPAVLLGLGMLTLKESTRWLVKQGRHDEAWESLQWIRADDSEETAEELREIQAGVKAEEEAMVGFRKRELLERSNFRRISSAYMVFVCQQCTGATALAYFGPQFFAQLAGSAQDDLLLTGIFGAIKVIGCGFYILSGMSERFGRKTLLGYGALGQCACMIIVAALDKTHPPSNDGTVSSAGIATVAFIYINIIIYQMSWGPLPWPLVAEMQSSRTREVGVGIAVSAQWGFNLLFSSVTPYMIANLGWGTFLFYAIMDILIAIFTWTVLKETRGKSLEEMETVFHTKAAFDVEVYRHPQGNDSEEYEKVSHRHSSKEPSSNEQ